MFVHCHSTRKRCQLNNCKSCCLEYNREAPCITKDLRATIKPGDFAVLGLRCSARHQKTRCHVCKQRGGLSGKEWQKMAVIENAAAVLHAYASRKALNAPPWICNFLYEEFDNKGTTTSFLMRLDCLRLCERVYCMYVYRSSGFYVPVLLTSLIMSN